LYDPADDLLTVPLPDLILGLFLAALGALPLAVMYPLPERFILPDALPALIPVARDLDFFPPPRLIVPLPDLILGFALRAFPYDPADDLLTVPLPDLILGFPLLDFDLPVLTFLVLVPLFVVTLTMIKQSYDDF
jgi:hypothetical protein